MSYYFLISKVKVANIEFLLLILIINYSHVKRVYKFSCLGFFFLISHFPCFYSCYLTVGEQYTVFCKSYKFVCGLIVVRFQGLYMLACFNKIKYCERFEKSINMFPKFKNYGSN